MQCATLRGKDEKSLLSLLTVAITIMDGACSTRREGMQRALESCNVFVLGEDREWVVGGGMRLDKVR